MRTRASLALVALLCAACSDPWSSTSTQDDPVPEGIEVVLRGAASIEIFALDPTPLRDPRATAPNLHGYPIRGSARLDDRAQRDELVELVLGGIREDTGKRAACFNPRHGLRAVHDGRTLELVICYECYSMHAHGDSTGAGNSYLSVPTESSVEPAVTRIYERAGLSIAGR